MKEKITENSRLMEEWDWEKNGELGLNPEEMTISSSKKVYWICSKCGYEWTAAIYCRVNGSGCPCCTNRIAVPGINDFQTKFPDVAMQWHPTKNEGLKPSDVVPGSIKIVWWQCDKCGYEWRANIHNRAKGNGCPCCMNRIVVPGVNDLQTKFPDIAVQWHPTKNKKLKPGDVLAGSHKKILVAM